MHEGPSGTTALLGKAHITIRLFLGERPQAGLAWKWDEAAAARVSPGRQGATRVGKRSTSFGDSDSRPGRFVPAQSHLINRNRGVSGLRQARSGVRTMTEATASDDGFAGGSAARIKFDGYPDLTDPRFRHPAMTWGSVIGRNGIEFMPRHFCRGGRCDP